MVATLPGARMSEAQRAVTASCRRYIRAWPAFVDAWAPNPGSVRGLVVRLKKARDRLRCDRLAGEGQDQQQHECESHFGRVRHEEPDLHKSLVTSSLLKTDLGMAFPLACDQ